MKFIPKCPEAALKSLFNMALSLRLEKLFTIPGVPCSNDRFMLGFDSMDIYFIYLERSFRLLTPKLLPLPKKVTVLAFCSPVCLSVSRIITTAEEGK